MRSTSTRSRTSRRSERSSSSSTRARRSSLARLSERISRRSSSSRRTSRRPPKNQALSKSSEIRRSVTRRTTSRTFSEARANLVKKLDLLDRQLSELERTHHSKRRLSDLNNFVKNYDGTRADVRKYAELRTSALGIKNSYNAEHRRVVDQLRSEAKRNLRSSSRTRRSEARHQLKKWASSIESKRLLEGLVRA